MCSGICKNRSRTIVFRDLFETSSGFFCSFVNVKTTKAFSKKPKKSVRKSNDNNSAAFPWKSFFDVLNVRILRYYNIDVYSNPMSDYLHRNRYRSVPLTLWLINDNYRKTNVLRRLWRNRNTVLSHLDDEFSEHYKKSSDGTESDVRLVGGFFANNSETKNGRDERPEKLYTTCRVIGFR